MDNFKACLNPSHENCCIVSICLDKQCKIDSRTKCQDCLLEQQQSHQNCQIFAHFSGKYNDQLKVRYTKKINLDQIYKNILNFEEKNLSIVNEEFENIKANLIQKINLMKKEAQIYIYEKYNEVKQQIEEQLEILKKFENLEQQEEQFKQFKDQKLNIYKLNDSFKEKLEYNINWEKIFQLEHQYEEIECENINYKELKNLQNDINQLLENYEKQTENEPETQKETVFQMEQVKQEFEVDQVKIEDEDQNEDEEEYINAILMEQKNKQHKVPDYKYEQLQNYISNEGQEQNLRPKVEYLEFIPFSMQENKCLIDERGRIYCTGKYAILKSNIAFKRDQNVKLSFQLDFEEKNKFYIGILGAENIPKINTYPGDRKSENYIGLKDNLSYSKFINESEKGIKISQVFRSGQIYNVEICYKQNLFTICDKAKRCFMANKRKFNQKNKEWYIFIEIYDGQLFKLV